MRAGKGGSDAYIAEWQRSAPVPCGEDMQAEAAAAAQAIEARYSDLCQQGLLHTLLTVRDRDRHVPAETVSSSITFNTGGGH